MAGGFWSVMTIVGPIVLLVVLVWAVMRNRTSRASYDRTERATRDLYKQEDRVTEEDKAV